MKYCEICKCNVSENHQNCPLCGSYLTEEGKGFDEYEKRLVPVVKYPKAVLEEQFDFLRTKNNYILLFIAAATVAINLLLTPGSLWSVYVIIGTLFTILCVMLPIANQSKIYIQIMFDLPVLTVLTIATELTVTRLGSMAVSVQYVLPSIYAGAVLLTDAMILATKKQRTTGYFTALLVTTIFAVLPQIMIWALFYKMNYQSIVTFIVFFLALINLGVVAICSHRRLKDEYDKKMNF